MDGHIVMADEFGLHIEEGNGLVVRYGGRTVLEHRKGRPALTVGRGQARYRMRHGCFSVSDQRLETKPLRGWRVESRTDGSASIVFDGVLRMDAVAHGALLRMRFHMLSGEWNRLRIDLPAQPREHIYGCGEQFSRLDLKGSKLPIWVQEQGVGRGHDLITMLADLHSGTGGAWYTTYFAQPTFLSSANYFVHANTAGYAVFDFRAHGRHRLNFSEIPVEITVGTAGSAPGAVMALGDLLGRQEALPEWAFDGAWLGVQGGRDAVERKLSAALAAGVKVGAVWAQDWEGRRVTAFGKQLVWNWKYDAELYPDLPAYIRTLNERGIKFLGYINCFLAVGTGDDENEPVPEGYLYKEARAHGYCVKREDDGDYMVKVTTFPAVMLDLTNPAAVEWIKKVIRERMIGIGLHGWMADFGEYLPTDAVLHSGVPAALAHNAYPAMWAKANYEAVNEAGRLGDVVYFMRAGYTGSSRHAASVWAGDQLVNWSTDDGLATVIPAGISLGICGVGFFHSDIGGYTTLAWIRRSRELFMRWAELAAFTPTMRTHEGNRPDSNHQFHTDAETLAHFARMTTVFTHIRDYHLHLAREYAKGGLPPIRHPYIHYENDPVVHGLSYQYLYGRDLMVAPVYKKARKTWKSYLPEDRWVHVWTGRELSGGWHRVDAPLGFPPVFYRADSHFAETFRTLKDIST